MYRKANRFFLCIVAAIVLLYSPLPILFFLLLFSATGLYSREGERGWKGINILLPWVSATRMGVVAETHLKTPFFFYNNTKKKKTGQTKMSKLVLVYFSFPPPPFFFLLMIHTQVILSCGGQLSKFRKNVVCLESFFFFWCREKENRFIFR